MKRLSRNIGRMQGFTIIELLVATVVFSVVLLVATIGILQIVRVYYKGVTESNTQNTARAIIDMVSQSIQFSGGNVTPTPGSPTPGNSYKFCVGNQRFSYTLGHQVENNPTPGKYQSYHALVQDTVAGCSSGTPAQDVRVLAVAGRELLGEHMRLSNLEVTSIGPNMYQVHVRVAYGDDDLLVNPQNPNASCKGEQAGSQFCSVSDLSTVVVKRVE
ncbi:MAG TPA: type II secretion system protein [Candidatus Saccharimonadales bacterium]|nr:type II secretion system protein [Candidatus Saccharimonadales bacterium]